MHLGLHRRGHPESHKAVPWRPHPRPHADAPASPPGPVAFRFFTRNHRDSYPAPDAPSQGLRFTLRLRSLPLAPGDLSSPAPDSARPCPEQAGEGQAGQEPPGHLCHPPSAATDAGQVTERGSGSRGVPGLPTREGPASAGAPPPRPARVHMGAGVPGKGALPVWPRQRPARRSAGQQSPGGGSVGVAAAASGPGPPPGPPPAEPPPPVASLAVLLSTRVADGEGSRGRPCTVALTVLPRVRGQHCPGEDL